MRKNKSLALVVASLFLATLWGCGSNMDSGGDQTGPGTTIADAAKVGSDSCKVCHTTIAVTEGFNLSVHDLKTEGCEACHGGGQFHKGIGPIPYPSPGPTQCTECHSLSAIKHTDDPATGGVIEGLVVKMADNDGCQSCHYSDHNPTLTINAEWSNSAHGGFLASGNVTSITADAWVHYNWDDTATRGSCQRCHTATGVSNFLNNPAGYAASGSGNSFSHLANWSATGGSGQQEVLYCSGCHSDVSEATMTDPKLRNPGAITESYAAVNQAVTTSGSFINTVADTGTAVPVDYPNVGASNVCLACHIGREVGDNITAVSSSDGILSFVNSHYLTAGGTVFNTSGYKYAGQTYTSFGFHKEIGVGDPASNFNTGSSGPCVACHMSEAEGHTFVFVTKNADGVIEDNNSPLCANCHSAMDADTLEATKENFHLALEELNVAMQNRGIYFFNAFPYFFKGANGTGGAFTDWNSVATTLGVGLTVDSTGTGWKNVMGAAFNYNLFEHDPGAYAHNSDYALKLIADSIDFLADGVIDSDPSFAATLIGQGMNITSGAGYSPIHDGAVAIAIADPQGTAATCSACHPAAPHFGGSRVLPRAAQWVSAGLNCASCHASNNITANPAIISGFADSRHGDVKGPGWTYSNAFRADCQRCHTSRGFIANLNSATVVVAVATDPYEVLTCNACHTSVVDGSLRAAGAYTATWSANSVTASVVFPNAGSSNICIRCHSARSAGANITNLATTTAHYLPAAAVVFGGTPALVTVTTGVAAGPTTNTTFTGGGYEFAGQNYADLSTHKTIGIPALPTTGPCVGCHMNGAAGHTWNAVTKDEVTGMITAINSGACNTALCHNGTLTPASLNASKATFSTALVALEALLNARSIYFNPADGGFYKDSGLTTRLGAPRTTEDNAYYATQAALPPVVSTRDLQGAAYNYWLFKYHGADPAGYVHNTFYSRKLIADSINMLDDGIMQP